MRARSRLASRGLPATSQASASAGIEAAGGLAPSERRSADAAFGSRVTSTRALFTRTSAGAVRTAASKASRSASVKMSSARAGASGKTAASAARRWRPASPPVSRASARARAMKARGLRGGRIGSGEESGAHREALFGARGETSGRTEREARKGLAGLVRREREERAHVRRLRGEPGGQSDPGGQAGEPEGRRVETRDERSRGAVLPRERDRRGAQPLAHGLRRGIRQVGRDRSSRRSLRRARSRGGEPGVSVAQLTEPSASARPSARMRTSSSWKKFVSCRMVAGVRSS